LYSGIYTVEKSQIQIREEVDRRRQTRRSDEGKYSYNEKDKEQEIRGLSIKEVASSKLQVPGKFQFE